MLEQVFGRELRCWVVVCVCVCVGGRTLGPEELAGDVERLATDNNDLLTVEELLGDSAGETSEKVAWLHPLLVSRSTCPRLSVRLLRTLPVNHDDRLESVLMSAHATLHHRCMYSRRHGAEGCCGVSIDLVAVQKSA